MILILPSSFTAPRWPWSGYGSAF